MEEPKDRLRIARERAGYANPTEAARKLNGITFATLSSNENGHRAISRKMSAVYGKAFGVDPGWILYGTTGESPVTIDGYSKEVLASVIREMADARILAPNDALDSTVKSFFELCEEHKMRLTKKSALEKLGNTQKRRPNTIGATGQSESTD